MHKACMGFLDVLFAKKKDNDKNWQRKLGLLLRKKKIYENNYDALYLYYYYTETNFLTNRHSIGHYDFFAQNFKFAETYGEWDKIYKSLNKQLPQNLKDNFNAAFEYYKNNYKKAEIEDDDGKFIDSFDDYDMYFTDHIQEVEKILYDYYKKLINK